MSTIKFLHIADVHLGYKQYGSVERQDDYARAFQDAIQVAIAEEAQFVLLAGDLFHKHSIDPLALYQASEILKQLQGANIPIYVIAGNHDSSHLVEGMSWLDYLNSQGLITLLEASSVDDTIALDEWREDWRKGAFIDLPCGVRVIGMRYYGASTPAMINEYARCLQELTDPPYTILMMHVGLEGEMPFDATAVSEEQLDQLQIYASYVALGHYHKPYARNNWIYNPGSLETVSIDETQWPERGMYLVEVNPETSEHEVTMLPYLERRQFVRVTIAVDQLEKYEDLVNEISQCLAFEGISELTQAYIDITLTGLLKFEHALISAQEIEALVTKAYDGAFVRINDKTSVETGEIEVNENQTRQEMERQVLGELAGQDARLQGRSDVFAGFALHLKDEALRNKQPVALSDELLSFSQANPLEVAHAN